MVDALENKFDVVSTRVDVRDEEISELCAMTIWCVHVRSECGGGAKRAARGGQR